MTNCQRYEKKSTLELFPDELFLEIFSFIKPLDLYYGFVNLNSRFNRILNDIDIHIHLIDNDQCELYQECMSYFASQIVYLAIDCHWTCLTHGVNLRPLSNLRSLYLPMPSDKQCREIRSENFPYLTYLTINNDTFKSILSELSSFPNLINCQIPRIYSSIIYQIEPTRFCLTLQSLHLCFCSINDLFDILRFIPKLKSLELGSTYINKTHPSSPMEHTNLTHLKVKLLRLDPLLEILLKSMPNLARLEFLWNGYSQSWSVSSQFDFKQFAYLINKYCTSLKRIDLSLLLFQCDDNIQTICSLYPRWFSSLSVERMSDDGSLFVTTKRFLSTNAKEIMIRTLLQSAYMIKRNRRVSLAKH